MIEVFWFFFAEDVFFHACPVFCGTVCSEASRHLDFISNKLISADE